MLKEFEQEVSTLASLRHPNVLQFLGVVVDGSRLSMVTELMPKGSLFNLIHNHSNIELDPKLRLRMALDVAKGMNQLHLCNPPIVHRDLKSPNLLVGLQWVVKVADFGTSRALKGEFLSTKKDGGTPHWMSPEALKGGQQITEKTDVWSFGMVLFEIVTRELPWQELESEHQVMTL